MVLDRAGLELLFFKAGTTYGQILRLHLMVNELLISPVLLGDADVRQSCLKVHNRPHHGPRRLHRVPQENPQFHQEVQVRRQILQLANTVKEKGQNIPASRVRTFLLLLTTSKACLRVWTWFEVRVKFRLGLAGWLGWLGKGPGSDIMFLKVLTKMEVRV